MTVRYSLKIAAFILTVTACCVLMHGQTFAGEARQVAEGVYVYDGGYDDSPNNSFAANAGIVIGNDGILVVDTLISSKTATEFIEDIREISDKPVKFVVNTHGHLDHTFGNSDLENIGAVIIGHADCRDYIEKFGELALDNAGDYGLTEDDLAGTRIAVPKLTFTDRMSIDLGGREVELIYPGPSHSPGSIVVYLPREQVLFTGDILFTDSHPFLGEGDLEGWQKALDSVKALGASKIIPGHGPVSTEKDLNDMKDYLTLFDKMARELATQSDDPEYISSEMLKSLPERKMGGALIKGNIQMKYLDSE